MAVQDTGRAYIRRLTLLQREVNRELDAVQLGDAPRDGLLVAWENVEVARMTYAEERIA